MTPNPQWYVRADGAVMIEVGPHRFLASTAARDLDLITKEQLQRILNERLHSRPCSGY
jgi:hypothetical protein